MRLRDLQTWLLEVVGHPDGVDAGLTATSPELARVLPGGPRLDATEQLQIYAYMFFERQQEVLDAEYPTVRFLLGPKRFRELTRAYLVEHPSRHYSLDHLGRALADYLEGRGGEHEALAIAIARVERAMEDMIDRPYNANKVHPDALSRLTPEAWAQTRLVPISALWLERLTHPTRAFMDAHRDGLYHRAPAASPTWAAVFRGSDDTVWRAEWPWERGALMAALMEGHALSDALQAVAEHQDTDIEALGAGLKAWFADWVSDGLFSDIQVASGDADTR